LSAGYRAACLASGKDALVTAGLRDASAGSGEFVGQQVEFRLARRAFVEILDVEVGGAWLVDGEFLREAPGAPAGGDSFYRYLQTGMAF
jgi:hypothetical protein